MESKIENCQISNKLSRKTLFAYGCGDFASNLCWTFLGSYLSIFYTDVVGMAPAIASAIMLIAKIWDGINDPMFGAIAERTNSKKGRFRPYIFYGAPFLALFSVLTFTTIGKGTTAILWASFTYIGCGMLYTVVNLSYGSMSMVMTNDIEDIQQLNSWRMMGTNLSSVLLNAISAPLLLKLSGMTSNYTASSYTKVAILYAICAVPLFYFVYTNCNETIIPPKNKTQVKISMSVKAVLCNKPLMILFFMQLFAMTAFFGRMGIAIYYLLYNVQRYNLISIFMMLPSLMTVIGILLTKNNIIKFGKKKMLTIGYTGAGVSLILIYFVGQTIGYENILLLILLHAIYGFFCFSFPIPIAMVPEAVNYQEDHMNVRSDGISMATVSLSTKFGSAIGVSGGLLLMGATGYIANVQQTTKSLWGINMTTNLIFGIMFLLCNIWVKVYPLNEKKNEEIRIRLEKKAEMERK